MKMLRAALAITLVLPLASLAQEAPLVSLQTADEAAGWEAIGRLDIDGRGFCTAALIAPDVVLTAAHCIVDRDTGEAIDTSRMQFLAGWRNGRAVAYRGVTQAIAAADFVIDPDDPAVTARHDIALIELDQPIRASQVEPMAIASQLSVRDPVTVVSYARDRADAPSLQPVCMVLQQIDGVYALNCDVDFGASGAPILRMENGVPFIAAVLVAKAEIAGVDVALGSELIGALDGLRARLEEGRSMFQSPDTSTVRIMTAGERNDDTGARFVSP